MKARPPKAPPVPAHPLYVPEADEVVWDGRFPLQRVRFRYRRRDGALSGPLTWEMWRRGGGVSVLPWDPWAGRVALIEQFRLPALAAGEEPLMTEVPAGLLDRPEDPDDCARRELREEAGLEAEALARIGDFMTMQGGSDEVLHMRLARVRIGEAGAGLGGLAEESEETRLVVLEEAEAFAMVADNRIRNAPCAMSLLWLQVNAARLRREWGIA